MGQLVRGWEYGILRFMAARFSEKDGLWDAIASAFDGDGHLSQAERLAMACAEHNIKVLIIHGKDDILVPVANSKRLAKVIPGAQFVEIENCGHMPQEEQPERFVEEVQKFIKSL
jgi:pimeloyl-ACP methyl ester carboxylesterase